MKREIKREIKRGFVNEVQGGFRAYYNDANTKDFMFADFEIGVSCLNAAYRYLAECRAKGLVASI